MFVWANFQIDNFILFATLLVLTYISFFLSFFFIHLISLSVSFRIALHVCMYARRTKNNIIQYLLSTLALPTNERTLQLSVNRESQTKQTIILPFKSVASFSISHFYLNDIRPVSMRERQEIIMANVNGKMNKRKIILLHFLTECGMNSMHGNLFNRFKIIYWWPIRIDRHNYDWILFHFYFSQLKFQTELDRTIFFRMRMFWEQIKKTKRSWQ